MSVALKLSSLLIRTLSKPIANSIKAQAREHERFRRICVSFAQGVHRLDMRMRLGLLQSTAAIDRQTRAAAAAELAKKRHHPIPTVKSEAQTQAELEKAARSAKEKGEPGHAAGATAAEQAAQAKSAANAAAAARIRPLSEAKAIDSGATFLSEAFLFTVGAGLILFESFRARRKESRRRSDVDDRIRDLEAREEVYKSSLIALEKEILELHRQVDGRTGKDRHRILPKSIWEVAEQGEEEAVVQPWYVRAWGYAQEASTALKEKLEGKKDQDDRDSPAATDKIGEPTASKVDSRSERVQ